MADQWTQIYVNNVALHATLNPNGRIQGTFFVDSEQHPYVRCSQHHIPDILTASFAIQTSGNLYSLRPVPHLLRRTK